MSLDLRPVPPSSSAHSMGTQRSRRGTAVFILTDDAGLLRLVRSVLEPACTVIGGSSLGDDADIRPENMEVVLIDTESVDHDAIAVVRRVCPDAQAIVLCREVREVDCVGILDADADYLGCPFRAHDLAARVRVAALRRFSATGRTRVYRYGPLAFDLLERRLAMDGRPVELTPSELAVLLLLASEPGSVAEHKRLLAELGLTVSENGRQALRSCVFRLRRKIERDPLHPEILLAEARVGYRLAVSESASRSAPGSRAEAASPHIEEVADARAEKLTITGDVARLTFSTGLKRSAVSARLIEPPTLWLEAFRAP